MLWININNLLQTMESVDSSYFSCKIVAYVITR